ncbi:MAG: DUF2723 domain-containing protein [Kiritimatiellae bacterium]|nr:DUF2723 domain-containing protein [Kiritimatiellia bacterium]
MKDRFFSKLDWAAFWTATVATFAVYFYTLGPSVGLEDSGELATAAANLGVPHPPGYPFWTFCSWLFCKAFSFVTYMGHPTPAWCVSLCSAVFGAFAAGCTAMLICRSGRDFVDGEEGPGAWLCFGGGVAGALTFALSPVEWSQSTIVEIYSLNALFLMWVFLLSYRWMRRPSDKILWTTAFVFGLGLTNYQVLLFAIVPLALVIAMKNIGMFRDVFIYLTPVALTYQVLQIGQLVRADRAMSADAINKHLPLKVATVPSTTVLVLGLAAIVVSVAAAAFLNRRGSRERARKVALFGGVGGVVLMLASMYIFSSISVWGGADLELAPLVEPWRYLLVAACAAGSVVAAALAALRPAEDPAPDGFAARVKAQFCRELWIAVALAALAVVFATMVPQAGDGGYLGPKYPWGKSTLVFVLVLAALFAMCSSTPRGLSFAVPVAGLHIAAFVLLSRGALNGLTHPTTWYFCWPVAWNFALLALSVLTLPNGLSVAGAAFFAQLGVSFYAYMPIVSDLRNPPMNWGYPRTWEGFKHAIMRGQYEAIGFQLPKWGAILEYFKDVRVQFTDVMIPFALVPFVAGRWIVRKENRKAFWQWMVPVLVCFLLMSVLLVGLANVKGDLQDGFIQKVKFISSHAMIALWIGYGLVFASTIGVSWLCSRIVRSSGGQEPPNHLTTKLPNQLAFAAAALMIAVSFFAPLVDNYCGDYRLGVNEVAFKLGGSEQNGHTFGWQFGAYQLEGAKAINEQIEADEEPLPDPTWPPPMEKYSIFFGGTDPGRFVPTYMIYSALFRPDVYLITQNALADDTYMSVERDLYGDEIWIPSKEDSAEAFNIYVDEVQRGVRQANGDVKIENGRVQVTGALGVMEINGILTKMMHDHDRLRHAFYVEESYVIPWMYPYLSPHGLIMKINADRTPYDAKTAAKDRDFWDWYVRRLLKDPAYRRDFAGQKSFSKLRAAIAGLYIKQGRYREGSQAFREACLLYPASPEATFRYAQECLMPFRKWNETLELMDYTDLIDPNNRRTRQLRDYVTRIRALTEETERLEGKRRSGNLTDAESLALARCYYEMGRTVEAASLVQPIADSLQSPADLRLAATVLREARRAAEAEKVLDRYLRAVPSDADAWLELAIFQHRSNRRSKAMASFDQAVRANAGVVEARLQKREQDLMEIYTGWARHQPAAQRRQPSSVW